MKQLVLPASNRVFIRTFLSVCLLSATNLFAQRVHQTTVTHPQTHITIDKPFRNAVFIQNNGQFDGWGKTKDRVLFGVTYGADFFQFTSKGFIARLTTVENKSEREREREREREEKESKIEERPVVKESFVGMEWVGANPNVSIETQEQQDAYFTYACGDPVHRDLKNVTAFGYHKIIYHNLYPGIDAVYTISEDHGGFKYSLIVHPGADLNQVQIRYTGDIKKMNLTKAGVFEVRSPNGTVSEMNPQSWYEGDTQTTIASAFQFSNNILSFHFPQGYDHNKTLVIDPWVVTNLANLSISNRGYDVDLDNAGNLLVYGGGDPNGTGTPAYQVAKYSQTGVLLWTFSGVIVTPSWTSSGVNFYAPANFLVERTTGKTYICQAYSPFGSQLVRIDATGVYDNFISIASTSFEEAWDMAFDCNNGQIYAIGGGTTGNVNFGVVNTITGVVTAANITGIPGAGQDVLNVTMDNAGTMFCIIASGTPMVGNYIFCVNNTFNGNVWSTYCGYPTYNEGNNKPYLPNFFSGNGHNTLAVNNTYLYYYDGLNLKAFDKATGAAVGTATTVVGQSVLLQGGIAVDECDNLYIGGIGQVYMYSFNGSTFSANGSIPLGPGLGTNHVHDIKYDLSANLIFVSGENFAGTYTATASASCATIQITATADCAGNGNATVTTTIPNAVVTYTWYDLNGNIVSTTTTTNLTDAVTGLLNGQYVVSVQINPLCGGPLAIDTIQAGGLPITMTSFQNVSCFGANDGSATATPTGGQPPIVYSWTTTPVQTNATATNLAPGTYTVTATDGNGCSGTQTVTITQPPALTGFAVANPTTICTGGSSQLTITPGGGTPTYTVIWNPGAMNGTSLTVSPTVTTMYTVTITDQNGCTRLDSAKIIVNDAGTADFTASPGGCAPWNVNFTDASTIPANNAIVSWFWDFGDATTSTLQNPAHLYTTPGSYTVTLVVTYQGGCTSTFTLVPPVVISAPPIAAFSTTELGGASYQFTDLSSNATTWQWSFGDNNTSSVQDPLHTYNLGSIDPPVTVQLIVTNVDGCMDTTDVTIDVRDFMIYVPNTFTPNGNGINEGFIPQGIGFENFEMWIFDRWGMMIYHCTDINEPWDGTFKGQKVQQDTYVWKVKVGDVFNKQHNLIGHVNVIY